MNRDENAQEKAGRIVHAEPCGRKEAEFVPPILCRECRFFKKMDYWVDMGHGVKRLAGGDVPTCTKWGKGDNYTQEDGWCYLAERKDDHAE